MTYEERLCLNKLKNKIYGNYDIDCIIKELTKYLNKEDSNENTVEIALAKAYYEKKDYIKSIKYLKLAFDKNNECPYFYLGNFKNYAMLSSFKDAYKYLLQYKEIMIAKGNTINISLFEKMQHYYLTGEFEVLDYNDAMLFIPLANIDAMKLHNQMITYYNMRYFNEAYNTCIKFNEYCKKNKVYLDFNPIAKLLENILIKERKTEKENLPEYYRKLEQAKNENNCDEIINNLKVITKYSLKRIELIFQSINIITKNGYCKEAREFTNQIKKLITNDFITDLLEKNIINQENYMRLSDEQKEAYNDAIEYGHSYYEQEDYENAYDIYLAGYYRTNQQIFQYYLGKILYKIGNLDESEKYLKEYLKTGSSKVAKTYLYLSTIEKRKSYNKKKLSLIKLYNDYSRRADNLFGEEFELLHIYDKDQDDDIVKLKLLNNELMKKRISE